ncbi:MAG: hypothetical protein B6D41_21640 [Chloroflexi bacterium UTCFX4]|nr:MAG: hypothetical protein B6D41_21640 [Chloroflexi bacterium UTCFX4]
MGFSGETDMYVYESDLFDLAQTLKGFPSHIKDVRDFELGNFNPKFASGGIRFHFHCVDGMGHVEVDVEIRTDTYLSGHAQYASFFIAVEPAAIDNFVSELQQKFSLNSSAYLRGN